MLVRKNIDVNEHERLSNITFKRLNQVNEHERLSNITRKRQNQVNEHERLSSITLKRQNQGPALSLLLRNQ